MIARLNGMRAQAGFASLPTADELWLAQDMMVVTTLATFDTAVLPGWQFVRHVGPVLEDEKVAVPIQIPWSRENENPLVLMSFSIALEQRSVTKLQCGLDALADLPLHVVATTGGIVDPNELVVPANAVVLKYAAHDHILERASLAITHGGHGTAMRALRHGVPMIVIPGLAHDQSPNAATLQEWGTGIALAGDADASAIRDAAQLILSTHSYRLNAKNRSMALANVESASNAADELEALVAEVS
jgi:MGT family glycosyltransferase